MPLPLPSTPASLARTCRALFPSACHTTSLLHFPRLLSYPTCSGDKTEAIERKLELLEREEEMIKEEESVGAGWGGAWPGLH